MSRPHIEFIQAFDLVPRRIDEGRFAGAEAVLLSSDADTGASTAIVSLPSAWRGTLSDCHEPVELFVLAGEHELGGQPFNAGSYAYLPAGSATLSLVSIRGGDILAMVEPLAARAGASPVLLDSATIRWAAATLDTVPAGLVVKPLRQDPMTGDRTWLAACPTGWMEDRAEVHPTVEESLMLRGDILLGTRGAMSPGCYFWRPPMVPHGPMYTRGGAEFFFRTKGGTITVDYEPVPEWEGLVAAYRAVQPLYPDWASHGAPA